MKRTLLTALVVVAALAPTFAFAAPVFSLSTPFTFHLSDGGATVSIAGGAEVKGFSSDDAYATHWGDIPTDATAAATDYWDNNPTATYKFIVFSQATDCSVASYADCLANPHKIALFQVNWNDTTNLLSNVVFTLAPTTLPTVFTGSVSDTLSGGGGIAALIGLVLALPVVFWLIEEIKKLFPATGGRKTNFERLTLDEKPARRQYARRSYLENTDDRRSRGDYLHEGS